MDYSNGVTRPGRGSTESTVPPTYPDETSTAVATETSGSPTSPDTAGRARATAGSTFLDELAQAMQAAAARERERIDLAVAEDAQSSVERARERAANETSELRRSAEEDIDEIKAWLMASIEQLQRDAAQRTDGRRARLEEHLSQHDLMIEAEVASVDVAVTEYGAILDEFFDELHQSTNPSEIASKAGLLPAPPDLDAVRAAARASAITSFADRDDAASGDAADGATEVRPDAASGDAADGATEVRPDAASDVAAEVQPDAASDTEPIGVMDPGLATSPNDPPAVLHDVDADAADSSDPSTEAVPEAVAEAHEPSAPIRLVRSFFSRTEIL